MVLIAVDLDDVLAQVSSTASVRLSASLPWLAQRQRRRTNEIGADLVLWLPPSVALVATDERKGSRAVSVASFLVRSRTRWRGLLGPHEARSYASPVNGRTDLARAGRRAHLVCPDELMGPID